MATASQTTRRVGFYLNTNEDGRVPSYVGFQLRPEALQRQQASRATVNQTLGGAYLDDFGAGLATISISGHTGFANYKPDLSVAPAADGTLVGGDNGEERFFELRDLIFTEWHAARARKKAASQDPDTVELIFCDDLDHICAVVAPMSFSLQRSRSRPMLYMYSMSLTEIRDASQSASDITDLIGVQIETFGRVSDIALEALENTAALQSVMAVSVPYSLGQTRTTLVSLLNSSAAQINSITAAIRAGAGYVSAELAVTINAVAAVQNAARNIIRAIPAALVGISEQLKCLIGRIAGAFGEAYCNFVSAFRSLKRVFDFSGIFGASNCSSTSGGSPRSAYAGVNVFEIIHPPGAPASPLGPGGIAAVAVGFGDPLTLAGMSGGALNAALLAMAVTISTPPPALTGLAAVNAARSAAIDNPFIKDVPKLRKVATIRGDTVQRFSLRELGDAGRWIEVASINRLLPPYLTDTASLASDRVVLAGKTLLIPDTRPDVKPALVVDDDSFYGRDLNLKNALLTETPDGDINVVGGYKNLVQALGIRLATSFGELIYHPRYGCGVRDFIGRTDAPTFTTLAQAQVKSALLGDYRIDSVRGITATFRGDALSIEGTAVAIDAARVPVGIQYGV